MNFPGKNDARRPETDQLRSDLEALSGHSAKRLPRIEDTARALYRESRRRSREGYLMRFLNSLKSRPALATALGVALVAAVLVAIPFSYTRTTGYRASLTLARTSGVDVEAVAGQFGRALDADEVKVARAGGGIRITADLPLSSMAMVKGLAAGFARALGDKGVEATASVESVTEEVTGNVYAMAADGIIEIRVNSEGLTDEEIEDAIRSQIKAAGLEAVLVDVESGEGEKRIEVGIQRETGDADPRPVMITVDGMEPPPEGTGSVERVVELKIGKEGKTLEEARAMALKHFEDMGFEDLSAVHVVDSGDCYRVWIGEEEGALGSEGRPSAPDTDSREWGELKKEFGD
jgi:hypothetical protein